MFVPILTQLEYLLRIVVAALCGAAIGYERESRWKTAGIRTHLITSLASALMMVLSKYSFNDILPLHNIGLDPSRIAAGIVTAIGFIGTGIIFVHKGGTVSGLTTAAGLWATVGVGMTIGAGLYFIGVACAGLLIIVQLLFHNNPRWIKKRTPEYISLTVAGSEKEISLLVDKLIDKKIKVLNMKIKRLEKENLQAALSLKFPDSYRLPEILNLLDKEPGIQSIDI